MSYTIQKITLSPQPILLVRRTVKRSAIAQTIGETLPQIFAFAAQNGFALTGPPITRYPEAGGDTLTLEPAMRIASGPSSAAANEAGILMDTLPGGFAAMTTHVGPYDQLHDAYVAMEEWMKANGHSPAGAPWESYVTDPGEVPDPKDWKTEVYWPLGG